MKILIVTATYPPSANGVAISTQRVVSALRSAGNTVAILGPDHKSISEEYYYRFQTAHNLPGIAEDYPIVLPWIPDKIKREIVSQKWDIIHVHHPGYISAMAVKLGKQCNTPVIFTYHSQYDQVIKSNIPYFPDWVYDLMLYLGTDSIIGNMAAVIANTRWLKSELKRKYPHVPIYYASTAGLPKAFITDKSKKTLRDELKIPVRDTIFIIVSRLSYEKNVSFVIQAFNKWIKTHRKSKLIIIGDGNNRPDLEMLVQEFRMKRYVRFVGKIDNDALIPWLNASDIFLYSSVTDTGTINLVESMSAGIPVVAVDYKATRELIIPDVNGYLSEANVNEFVKYMSKAVTHKARLSLGAIKKSTEFTLSKTTKDLYAIYEKVHADHSAKHNIESV